MKIGTSDDRREDPPNSQREPILDYALRSAVWELTLACPFHCAYCGSGGGRARPEELSTAECLDVAAQLGDLGCRRVSLIGGEVFLRSDWREIVAALTGRGIRVCIITNGYRMTGDLIRDLRALRIESVAVSVDGPERVHDAYRQTGSCRRALDAIQALTAAGIPTSVISTLRADNAPLLEEFYGTLKAYPIFAWQLQACSPMGGAAKNGLDVAFDPLEVIRFVADHAPTAPFLLGIADNVGYYTPEEGNLRGAPGYRFDGCSAGLTALGIDSVGNVRGCESMYDERFIEGNLRRRTLREIWEDPAAFAYNRQFAPELLTGACAACPHGDLCAAGCRSYNYFANGGKLYESPRCARNRLLQEVQ